MAHEAFIDTVNVRSKGEVTIPKDIRNILKIAPGSRLSFIVREDGEVKIANAAIHAMQTLQKASIGDAERLGIETEEDVVQLVKKIRHENSD